MAIALSLFAAAVLSAAAGQEPVESMEELLERVRSDRDAPSHTLRAVDPNPTPLICPFRGEIDYEPGAVECGRITVPENREVSDSRLIHIHYVRIAAWGEDDAQYREDPVIYLTGGPGVGVDPYVARLKDHPVAEHRDLYILEQRGIGTSTDFCEQYSAVAPSLETSLSMQAMEIAGAERMRLCFQEAAAQGVDLRGYNTVENARDIKALRESLGLENWNIWGISYGSHLGQMLLRVDPDGVRAIVLDAIVPNDLVGLFDYDRIFQRVVDNVASTCTTGAACESLDARLWAAMGSLRDDPLILTVDDGEVYPSGEQWVPPALPAFFPFMMAYEQDEHPAMVPVVNATIDFVERRDPVIIAGVEALLSAPGGGVSPGVSVSQGMSDAIRCNDGYVHGLADNFEDAEPGRWSGLLGTLEGSRYAAQVCEDEGLAPRERADYALVQTQAPTLIVNGAWDPVTPPWLAVYLHENMPGSRYVEVPYAGHGPTRSMPECAGPVLTAFFDDLDVEALDASCLEAGVDAPEPVTLASTRAPFLAAALLADAPASFAGPALWISASILPLLIGAVMIPLGFFGRIIDRTPVSVIGADIGGARLTGWLAALTGLTGSALIGAGAYAASEISQIAVLAGFAKPAGAGMWLMLLTGGLGLISLVFLVRAFFTGARIRIGTLLGFAILGSAAISLTGFALVWDLTPF